MSNTKMYAALQKSVLQAGVPEVFGYTRDEMNRLYHSETIVQVISARGDLWRRKHMETKFERIGLSAP